MRKHISLPLCVSILLGLVACGPAPADEGVLVTQVAATIYAGQTVQARAFTPTPPDTLTPHRRPTSTSTASPTATSSPTRTPRPTRTPTPRPTRTPTPLPDAVVSAEAANLRAGPGTNYAIVGQAQQGDALQVIGRSPGGDWLLVVAPDGRRGWLSISLLKVNLVLDGVAVAELPPTPTPAVTPTPNPTPAPRVCPPGPALVQVISELDMQLTLKLQGPEEVIMIIPAGATQHYCLAPGEYSYAATAPSGETKAGAKAFVHEPGNCECWWWYATTSPLVMRAPIPGSCKCSPDPALYVSPPLAPGTHPAISPEKAAASCPTAGMCISYPEPGASIGGQVHVMGTANIEGFHHYKIEWWGEGGSGWNYLLERDQPVVNGELMMLDTRTVPAGRYGLRLTVVDQTGNYPEPFEIWWTVKH